MKKRKKCYQILNTVIDINGTNITKKTIVYYDEIGLEEYRENYTLGYVIKEGYIPFYLTLDVPAIYNTVSDEIKYLYLETISDGENINENNTLTVIGNEVLNKKIRTLYSQKISQVDGIQESVERYVLDGTPIPQTILDKREILKLEYHNIISYLEI